MSTKNNYASYESLAPKKEPVSSYKVTQVENLEQRKKLLQDNAIVCIDLWASWCQPCKIVSPKFSKLAEQYNSPGKCLLVKENIDLELTRDYQITGIPAFIFYRHGKLVTSQNGKPVSVVGGNIATVQKVLDSLIGLGV